MDTCSIIVPIDLSRRPLGVLRRLRAFLDAPWPAGCTEIVVAHLTYGTRWDRVLERMVSARRTRMRNIVLPQTARLPHEPGIPLGRLRNIGAEAASGMDLFFADVDLVLPPNVIEEARQLRRELERGFVSVPVIYLSHRVGLDAARRLAAATPQRQVADHLRTLALNRQMDGLALNSSLILVNKEHYRRLEGFHERYCGHGFEDFDLLMRLAHADEKAPLPASVLVNVPQASPGHAVGFRSYLARFTAPVLARGTIAYHVHHWRPKGDGYFEARQRNYELFCERMRSLGIVDDSLTGSTSHFGFSAKDTAALLKNSLGLCEPDDEQGSPLFSPPRLARKSLKERLSARAVAMCESAALSVA